MKKKVIAFLLIMSIICMYNRPMTANAAVDNENNIQRILQMVNDPEPIEEIVKGNINVSFTYDSNKLRVKKTLPDGVVSYVYANDLLVGECGKNNLQFCYSDIEGNVLCTEVTVNGQKYFLGYDEIGNVSYIYDENDVCVCHYEYNRSVPMVYEYINGELVLNCEEEFVGNVNPFRYQGWYYDTEIMHYYLGKGIYYDAENNLYVNNPYTVNLSSSARSSEPEHVRWILNMYSQCLSSSIFGAVVYTDGCVTQAEWNAGNRWYDSLDETDLLARCIYAENNGGTGTNGSNDRVAEAVVIMNRIIHDHHSGDTTPYNVITRAAQFSTVNPGTYSKYLQDTAIARQAHSPNSEEWKQATLLACTLTYFAEEEDLERLSEETFKTKFRYISSIPMYIDDQVFWVGLNKAYEYNWFSVENGKWKYNGILRENVALAGVTPLPTTGNAQTILQQYYGGGYNIFFN